MHDARSPLELQLNGYRLTTAEITYHLPDHPGIIDQGLNHSMIDRCRESGFEALTLTVDTITGGNRERDLRTGFTSPPRLTPRSLLSFALHPRWSLNYMLREKFRLPQLDAHVKEGTNVTVRFFKGSAFSVTPPNFVELEIVNTEPGFKGDTATGTTKPATLETGYKISVPLFVNQGDRIRVDTRSGEYMDRV